MLISAFNYVIVEVVAEIGNNSHYVVASRPLVPISLTLLALDFFMIICLYITTLTYLTNFRLPFIYKIFLVHNTMTAHPSKTRKQQ